MFPIQYQTFDDIYDGKDVVGRDKTGSGKTIGYILPLLEKIRVEKLLTLKHSKRPLILVVVPTRELSQQVQKEFDLLKHREQEFKVFKIVGGVDYDIQERVLRRGVDIIAGTPGRIIDLIERKWINFMSLRTMILDEADEMLRMGFDEDIEKIYGYIMEDKSNEKIQNLLFSATFPDWVMKIAERYLAKGYVNVDLVKGKKMVTPDSVKHYIIKCNRADRMQIISDVVVKYGGMNSPTIIFTDTKTEANQILLNANIKTTCQVLHGDIPQK